MIKVAVCGSGGRMGQAVIEAVSDAEDMELICGIDPKASSDERVPVFTSIEEAVEAHDFDVLVDFTQPDVVAHTIAVALPRGIDCVIGTTGLDDEQLAELAALAPEGTCLFVAPNFTIGAVLMMRFAAQAAPFFPDAEIIEYHHGKKKDAPSGTAWRTATLIHDARGYSSQAPGCETELPGAKGARGAKIEGVPVHSVRSMAYMASQEVLFGSMGQSLSIRHDSWDRSSYMPGVLLAIRHVGQAQGLVVGLENFMD